MNAQNLREVLDRRAADIMNHTPCDGMTLRDWFAGHALAGWIASTRDPEASAWDATWWARNAYETADAMLKAREEKL